MLSLLAAVALTSARPTYYGGDPSEIPEVEAYGGYYTADGKREDPLVLMKRAGWTAVRLRIWNDPQAHDNWCDLPHTLAMARRVRDAGLQLMLDFHYSDWWADPGKQNKPAAWAKLSNEDLQRAVHDYSRDVLRALVAQGTPPAVVQPGNEITNGMLWPTGHVEVNTDGWDGLFPLLKAAILGIKEGAGAHTPRIMIHLDQGGNNSVYRLWFDQYFKRGGEADMIGLSYYPFWHGTLDDLRVNLNDLSRRYKRDVLVAETSYPYDPDSPAGAKLIPGVPATPAGQLDFLRRLTRVVRGVPRGSGVLWWAPAWIPAHGRRGGGFMHLALFDNAGEALPAFWELGRAARGR